jgi:hypothetical protein
MLRHISLVIKSISRLRGYEPQPVTLKSLAAWLLQFPYKERWVLLKLLAYVRFVSKREAVDALCELNESVLARLSEDGVGIENVIYVSLDSAGSSSGVMLNMLRDQANLERRGANFIHSRDVERLSSETARISRGAIVYVDDFAGSGKQFVRNRTHAAEFIAGSFSEFFLAVCICEEADEQCRSIGVEPVAQITHRREERPLHNESTLLEAAEKEAMRGLCRSINKETGLGFKKLATSVVLYRNAPNTMPLVLRGSLGQAPVKGLTPRYDDLPVRAGSRNLL